MNFQKRDEVPARSFPEKLDLLAEVAVKVGLGLKPDQEVVMTAPLEALPLVRRITEHAYKAGASLVTALVSDEKRLQQLVARSTYTPLEIAAGATDLMNEAATSKISGEEERYSHTELAVIEANLLGAREIVGLCG